MAVDHLVVRSIGIIYTYRDNKFKRSSLRVQQTAHVRTASRQQYQVKKHRFLFRVPTLRRVVSKVAY